MDQSILKDFGPAIAPADPDASADTVEVCHSQGEEFAMLEGKIRKLDLASRTVVVLTTEGKEVTARVPEGASIEVSEPETMGTMGGQFEDLEVGYLVELDVHELTGQDTCTCASLVCVS